MGFVAQVAHVFRKDLRRFWPVLVPLIALLALHVTIGLPGGERIEGVRVRIPFAPGLFPLAFTFLCAAVLHEDRPGSDLAFWPTRPIHAGAMLAAKVLFVGVFLWAIPVAAHVHWVRTLGGGGPVLGLTADTMLYQGALVAAMAAAASVSGSMRTFVLVALAGLVASSTLTSLFYSDITALERGLPPTRHYLMKWVTVGAGAAVVALQYLRARTALSVAVGLLVYVAGAGVVQTAALDLTVEPNPVPDHRYDFASHTDLRLQSVQVEPDREEVFGADDLGVFAHVSLRSPDRVFLVPIRMRSTISGAEFDGSFDVESLERRQGGRGPYTGGPSGLVEGMTHAGVSPARDERGPRQDIRDVFATLTAAEFERMRPGDHLRLEVEAEARRPRIVAALPLIAGAEASLPDGVATIDEVKRQPGAMSVRFTYLTGLRALEAVGFRRWQTPTPILVNRSRGEFMVQGGGGGGGRIPAGPVAGGAVLSGGSFDMLFTVGRFTDEPVDDAWFDDAELAFVDEESLGVVTLELEREIPRWPAAGGHVDVDGREPRSAPARTGAPSDGRETGSR